MAMGTIYAGSSYIQTLNKINSSYYNLLLQPNGGFVGLGTTNPTVPLDVVSYATGIGMTPNFTYLNDSGNLNRHTTGQFTNEKVSIRATKGIWSQAVIGAVLVVSPQHDKTTHRGEPRDEETTGCAMRVVTMTITCSVFSTVSLFIISTRGR